MIFLGNLLILYLRVIDYTYDTLILRHAQGVYTGGRYTNTHGIASSVRLVATRAVKAGDMGSSLEQCGYQVKRPH